MSASGPMVAELLSLPKWRPRRANWPK